MGRQVSRAVSEASTPRLARHSRLVRLADTAGRRQESGQTSGRQQDQPRHGDGLAGLRPPSRVALAVCRCASAWRISPSVISCIFWPFGPPVCAPPSDGCILRNRRVGDAEKAAHKGQSQSRDAAPVPQKSTLYRRSYCRSSACRTVIIPDPRGMATFSRAIAGIRVEKSPRRIGLDPL